MRFVAIILLGIVLGCEASVSPITGTSKAYSPYGVLTPDLDTQWVRVYPVEDLLTPIDSEPWDLRFTSIDLATGHTRVWQDSIVQEPDSQLVHVYFAPFEAAHGRTYRLRIRDGGGRQTHLTVRIPQRVRIEQHPFDIVGDQVHLPVFVDGEAPNLLKVVVKYKVQFDMPTTQRSIEDVSTTIPLAYRNHARPVEGGWRIDIRLDQAFETVSKKVRHRAWVSDWGTRLLKAELVLLVANKEWEPPGGMFDPEVLVEPGMMTNVENGFGFVGGGYTEKEVLEVPDSIAVRAGFRSLYQDD